jgi:hypothetical protein
MLKSEYAANLALVPIVSGGKLVMQADKIMKLDKSFAFRLAALNALGCDKGKWIN